ncbi:B12-binding domain-containing radical SAM protein [Fibrobacterota bacterium]
MKVLFLNPPYFPLFSRESRSPCVTKSNTLYWPMFLSYTAGFVEQDDNEILLLDAPAMGLDQEQTLERVALFKPTLAVLNVSTPSIKNDLKIGKTISEKVGCKIALMGTHASALPEEIIEQEKYIHYVIVGEAEMTARDLVRHLRKDSISGDPSGIEGLCWRRGDEVVRNQDRPRMENINDIPWVSKTYHRHLYSCYRRYFYGANLHPLIVILSGRGCPYKCTFCAVPQTITGHRYRTRDVDDVVNEMEWIYDNFEDVGEIFFEDDTFTAKPKRTVELCREIIQRNRKMVWSANARADVKYEVLEIMKKAGCRELCVGFESASSEVLENVQKGAVNREVYQFMRDANKAGIIVHGCFMVGNPGDTEYTLRATLEMAKKLNPLTAQFYPIMAYPGTVAFDKAKAKGKLVSQDYKHWLDKDGHHNTTVLCSGLSPQELVDFCDRARRQFYLRPRYLMRALGTALSDKRERYRIIRGARTLFKHLFRKHGGVNP